MCEYLLKIAAAYTIFMKQFLMSIDCYSHIQDLDTFKCGPTFVYSLIPIKKR